VDPEPSHVLIAMGLSRVQANHSVRISFGRFTTEAEIHAIVGHLTQLMRT
jgi:cysteine desulfurase